MNECENCKTEGKVMESTKIDGKLLCLACWVKESEEGLKVNNDKI